MRNGGVTKAEAQNGAIFAPEGRSFHTPNVVTIVAWAGVGKSTLVNHWLRRMTGFRSAPDFRPIARRELVRKLLLMRP